MRKVEVRTLIRTTPARIIAAFTEPAMLGEWWQVERVLVDKRPGGLYTLAWNISDEGFGFVSTGIVKSYNPDAELIIENFIYLNPEKQFLGPMSLVIRAEPAGDQAELWLCQDGYQEGGDWDWYYEAVRQAWPVVVERLKQYLEGKFSI